jgi:hypothetical protein
MPGSARLTQRVGAPAGPYNPARGKGSLVARSLRVQIDNGLVQRVGARTVHEHRAGRSGGGRRPAHVLARPGHRRRCYRGSLVPSARVPSFVLVRDRRMRRPRTLAARACLVLLGVRGSRGDRVRPSLCRSELSHPVAEGHADRWAPEVTIRRRPLASGRGGVCSARSMRRGRGWRRTRSATASGAVRRLVLLCRTGTCARLGAEQLTDFRTRVLEGGLAAWQEAGHPVVLGKAHMSLRGREDVRCADRSARAVGAATGSAPAGDRA